MPPPPPSMMNDDDDNDHGGRVGAHSFGSDQERAHLNDFSDDLTEEEREASMAATAAAVAEMEGADAVLSSIPSGAASLHSTLGTSSSSSSSASKLSIRLPRSTVTSAKSAMDMFHEEEEDNLPAPPPPKAPPIKIGRRRRGADSDESAYSEDSAAEVFESDEDDLSEYASESSGSEMMASEDDYYSDEESYGRKKGSKKSSRSRSSGSRHGPPPITIPYTYRTSSSGEMTGNLHGGPPVYPLPANMSSIPMFANMPAQRPLAPAAPLLTPEQLKQLTEDMKKSMQEEGSKTANEDGKEKSEDGSTTTTSPELSTEAMRERLTSMLANPQWRTALLQKLAQNRQAAAAQAAQMGLTPATAPTMPSMQPVMYPPIYQSVMASHPYVRHSGFGAPPPSSATGASSAHRSKSSHGGSKKRGKRVGRSLDLDGVEVTDDPISSRRARRSVRGKTTNYSKFFEDEEEGVVSDDQITATEDELDEEDASFGGHKKTKKPAAAKKSTSPSKRPAKRSAAAASDEDDGYSDFDEDEETPLSPSEMTGVEKILSYRTAKDGTLEVFVKYYNSSYLHAEWISEEQFVEEELVGARRLKTFMNKPLSQRHYSATDIFNPDFIKPDRVITGWQHPDPEDQSVMTWSYFVKWTGLTYSDATWEKRQTLMELERGPELIEEFESRPTLKQRQERFVAPGYRPPRGDSAKTIAESPIYRNDHTLRPYQLEGLNWLVYCWLSRQSCIIADEMGLGKTVQSVAFVHQLYTRYSIDGPFLIVAPLSTIPHWEREFAGWTHLNCITYHGTNRSRELMYEHEFHYMENDQVVPNFYKFDVVITTYEMALAGFEHLSPIRWRAGIFDEAHRLKNRTSKASEVLKTFSIEHKVLLTGTPLQNNIEELWSLLNFLQPQRFYSEEDFVHEYGNLRKSEDVLRLQELLKPLMLRRLKEDVETSIPVKEETVIEVELTSIQKRYYRAILERNFAFLAKGTSTANAPNLLNTFMELRKCCIHPYLIDGAEDRIVEEFGAQTAEQQMEALVQASGKLVLVDKLLRKLRESGHKVLIFSQMTRCLDLLVDYLRWKEYPFERIDGMVKGDLRQAAIDRFNDPESDSFVFLLCTRAGGVGINLTAADTVVIFDSDWNPQNDIQAQARCHRIGQTKTVKVYRLITRNTYEREMFDKAGMKLGLDRAVLRKIHPNEVLDEADADRLLGGASTTRNPNQLSKAEVETLLKKGAYGMIMDNDDDAVKFCDEDIDQILERRTTIIKHDGGGGVAAEGGSIFSKASFAATADDLDIEIDDPNFWELWARRLDLDPRKLLSSSGVVVDEPRIKRQARRLRRGDLSLAKLDLGVSTMADDDGGEFKDELMDSATQDGSNIIPWSHAERMDFLDRLMKFGIHRLDMMRGGVVNAERTDNDLVACTRQVIKICLEEISSPSIVRDSTGEVDVVTPEAERMREDSEKLLLAHLDFDRSATFEQQSNEELKDFSKADLPYGGCTRRQALEYRSFLKLAPLEPLVMALRRNAKGILLRLQLLDFIRQLVEGHKSIQSNSTASEDRLHHHGYNLPVPSLVGTAAPVRGWSKLQDESLMIGVYRHGYGQYELIRQDPQLVFVDQEWRLRSEEEEEEDMMPSKLSRSASKTDGNDDDDDDDDDEEGDDDTAEDDAGVASVRTESTNAASSGLPSPAVTDESFSASESSIRQWPSRRVLDERLVKVVLAMEKRTQAAAKLAIQAAQNARDLHSGGLGSRRSAAAAASRFGQQSRRRRRRARGGNDDEEDDDDGLDDEDDFYEEDEFEDDDASGGHRRGTRRTRRDVDYAPSSSRGRGSRGRGRGRGAGGRGRGRGGGRGSRGGMIAGRGTRADGLSVRWTKKDRAEFLRIAGFYGLPAKSTDDNDLVRDWSEFREQGEFSSTIARQPDSAFDEFAVVFEKACEVASKKKTRRRGPKAAIVSDESEMEEDDDADAGTAEEDEEDNDDDNDDDDDGESSALPVVPTDRARKALSRIAMFERLRQQLVNPLSTEQLCAVVSGARRTSGLPSWWEFPEHDAALLQAVSKYGLGQWERMVMDEEFPFRAVYDRIVSSSDGVGSADADVAADIATESGVGRRRRSARVVSEAHGPLQVLSWPIDTIMVRRIESLIELGCKQISGADEAKSGSGRRKRAHQLTVPASSDGVNEDEEEDEEEMVEEEMPHAAARRRAEPDAKRRQTSITDFLNPE